MGKDRPAVVELADKTFEDATAAVTAAAHSLIFELRSDEVGIEFDIQLSAQTGASIASAAARTIFGVSMTWRRGGAAGE